MSKLTELLQQDWLPSSNDTQGFHDPKWAGFVASLRWLLPAHDAEIREQSKREQMEADLDAIDNAYGRHFLDLSDGFHYAGKAICDSWAKAHPEKAKQKKEAQGE